MLSNKPFKNIDKKYESGKLSIQWSPQFNETFYKMFKEGGELQQLLDAEILKGLTEYVPRDTGAMLDFALSNTIYGDGKIIFQGPYVLPQFQGFREGKNGELIMFENYSNQTGFRGPEWFERWKEDHGDEIVEYINKKAGEMLNGK